MSRKMVRVGGFLVVASLAFVVLRIHADEPHPKPARGGDDPFGADAPTPAAAEKPKPSAQPPAKKAAEDLENPFGDANTSKPPAAKKPATKPAEAVKPRPAADVKTEPQSAHKLHGGERAILKALKREVKFDFTETPLKDVLDYVSEEYRIPIVRDAAGLKDAGVDPECPVTCHLSDISLQSALEIVLDELQLKWAIHHEVLMITSPQKAESDEFMYTKVYDVADLVMPIPTATRYNPLAEPSSVVSDPTSFTADQPTGGYTGMGPWIVPSVYARRGSIGSNAAISPNIGADFKPLMDLIQNTVATKSWIDNGGNGTISEVPTSLSLAFSQTREVHAEVARLLADLRARQRAMPTFRIELQWLWLDPAHRDRLFGFEKHGYSSEIDSKRLSQVEYEVPNFRAYTALINAQQTTVAAGDRRAVIVNAVPGANEAAGYCPIVTMPNVGVAATISALMQPAGKSAMISVQSVVTRWTPKRGPVTVGSSWGPGSRIDAEASQLPANSAPTPSRPVMGSMGMGGMGGGFMQVATEDVRTVAAGTLPAVGGPAVTPTQPSTATSQPATSATSHASISSHGAGSTSCPIDLPVMPTQEFGTTLVVPLGKPVVVGSVTFAPAGDAGVGEAKVDAVEVYLIATTSIVKNEATGKAKPKSNTKSQTRNPKQIGKTKSE